MAPIKDIELGFSLSGRSLAVSEFPLKIHFFNQNLFYPAMLNIKKNIPLAPYTTFKIGGPAKFFAEAGGADEIKKLCEWAKENLFRLPAGRQILILGGGSNILISDKGFGGLVIKVQNSKFKIQSSRIYAEAGVPLAKLVLESAKNNLTGLEWAIGIPGTVGGAINGNTGAFGKSIAGAVKYVDVLEIQDGKNKDPKIKKLNNEKCGFGYRKSIFKRNPNLIILSAVFSLEKKEKEKVQAAIKDFSRQRAQSNTAGCSAGCFFKNPDWEEIGDKEAILSKFPELKQFSERPKISSGFLIEQVGLKGKKIGGAAVALKHANFILNNGFAKAKDVVALADLIKKKIRERYGIALEEEVAVIG